MRRAVVVGAIAATVAVAAPLSRPADSQELPTLRLRDQTFAVAPGGVARFEFVVAGDLPEIAPTTTTTTTTTSTTTSTTTTTTTTVPGAPTTAPAPDATAPGAATNTATTTAAPTTTTTTLPPGPNMTVQVRSHRAIATREGVAAALSGAPGPVLDILEFDLADVGRFDGATGERLVEVDVPIAAGVADVTELDLLQPGVHPVSVQVRRDGALVASATTLVDVIRSDGPGRGPFTFVALAVIDDTGPAPNDTEMTTAIDAIERTAELAATFPRPITVALPPDLLTEPSAADAIADVVGSLDLSDRLLVLPDQPLDPSAAIDAGLGDELVRGVATGETALRAAFTSTPVSRSAWLVDEPITPAGATAIRDLGYPLLVLPFERYERFDNTLGAFTDPTLMLGARLPDDTSMRAIVIDPVTELLEPDAPGSPLERAVRLMGEISALRYQFDPDRRSMLLTPPGFGVPDPDVMTVLAQFADEHPDIVFESLGQLPELTNSLFLDGDPYFVDLDDRPGVQLSGRVELAQGARLRAVDTGSMLDEGDPRRSDWDARLRTALSTGLTDSESAAIVNAVEREIETVRAHVVQPESFTFTIAGTSAAIPLRVENAGPVALTVRVHAESDKLIFPSGDLQVVLEPNQINDVDIPVEARSNGVFPVVVELLTPAGNPITEPVELTARVSTLTGLGRVFTVGAVLVLATWWLTYFRRRRDARRDREVGDAVGRHPSAETTPAP